jgi:4-hydroxybenzoate polyprenyltransferase
VPGIALIAYSLLKRFTSLCHFGIGLCMAMAPLAAFVAASGSVSFDAPVLLLALFTFCWLSGFDVIYALQDLQSDRRTRVHSLPASLGSAGAQVVAAGVHRVAVAAIVRLWWILGGGVLSGAALLVAIGAFLAGYVPRIPLPVRFFPVSAVAGVAGAMIPLLGGLP